MLCGKTKAAGGFIVVQGNALAVQVEIAEVEMRIGIPLPGRAVEPFGGIIVVLSNALAHCIAHAEVNLRTDIPLNGGFSIPSNGLGLV